MSELYKQLKNFGKVKVNEPLSKHTAFKVGGPVDFFVIVDSTDKLVEMLKFLDGEGIQYFILGGGTNMLVSDEGFRGAALQVKGCKLKVKSNVIECDSGCSTAQVAQEFIKNNFTGFEWGVGVPGTIGGAVRGNAGAMGGEMNDCVEKVEVYRDGEVLELLNEECEFDYRDSIFKHNNDIILRAYLQLEKTDNKDLAKKALANIQYRTQTQPAGYSAGCVFKNVKIKMQNAKLDKEKIPAEFLQKQMIPAGWLVEQVGMKGVKSGQAQVSEKHGNFILNLGGATALDILNLIDRIKEKVYDKFVIELEEEIQMINF